jgi:hypothetical protein
MIHISTIFLEPVACPSGAIRESNIVSVDIIFGGLRESSKRLSEPLTRSQYINTFFLPIISSCFFGHNINCFLCLIFYYIIFEYDYNKNSA